MTATKSLEPIGASYTTTNAKKFRRYLSQVLASSVRILAISSVGITLLFPSIAIPALTNIKSIENATEIIHLNGSEASWFVSIAVIFNPLGSLLAGIIREQLGYKYSLIAFNIPACFAWLLFYYSAETWHVFVANALLGFTTGLMETPASTYIGEICEPAIRGILSVLICFSIETGLFTLYLLSTTFDWRQVSLFCLAIPITVIVTTCWVPDAPIWLLSKNRTNDAMKALQWLRGWVAPSDVQMEFEQLQKYKKRALSCDVCARQEKECSHPSPTFLDKMSSLLDRGALRPICLIIFLFAINQFTGLYTMRPFAVQIMIAYGVPIDGHWVLVISEAAGMLAILILLCTIHIIGKRKLFLFSIVLTAITCLTLGSYGLIKLPSGWNSFEKHPSLETEIGANNLFPFYAFIALTFFSNLALVMVPYMFLCEILPLKVRAYASSLCTAANYLIAAISIKLYYNFELMLSMAGVSIFYGVVGLFGFVVMYFILPETEGCDLADIELYFADDRRKITDRIIPKATEKCKLTENDVEKQNKFQILDGHNNDSINLRSTRNGFDNKAFLN